MGDCKLDLKHDEQGGHSGETGKEDWYTGCEVSNLGGNRGGASGTGLVFSKKVIVEILERRQSSQEGKTKGPFTRQVQPPANLSTTREKRMPQMWFFSGPGEYLREDRG